MYDDEPNILMCAFGTLFFFVITSLAVMALIYFGNFLFKGM